MRSLNKFFNQKRAKAILVLSGYRNKDLARKSGLSETWCSLIINNKFKSKRARKIIAKAIGRPIEELWPEEKAIDELWPPEEEKGKAA